MDERTRREMIANPTEKPNGRPSPGSFERADLPCAHPGAANVDSSEELIHVVFAEWAKQTPNAIALVSENDSLTYAELNSRANQVAHALKAHGVGLESRVAVCAERSIELVVALVGILKAGAAYVPLDPDYPIERLDFMLQDSSPAVILTEARHATRISQLGQRVLPLLNSALYSDECPSVEGQRARSLAYVIYTSGSTGTPKGVMIEHRSVLRLVRNVEYACVGPGDCVAHCASPSFDAATWELWGPLLNGAKVLIVPQSILFDPMAFDSILVRYSVTALFLTVGLFNEYVDVLERAFSRLRYLITGGDVVSPATVTRALAKPLTPKYLLNAYGPTETTTFATTFRVEECGSEVAALPIGLPISHTQIHVLDTYGKPVPSGDIGEICIGGIGVARGYLNRPALTAERFLPDPFGEIGARLYRTGDLGRIQHSGHLEFLGRNDSQIKIRGFRVELGEIECVLLRYPHVKQAAVVVRVDETDSKRLVGYLSWKFSRREADRNNLTRLLSDASSSSENTASNVEHAEDLETGGSDQKILEANEGDRMRRGNSNDHARSIERLHASLPAAEFEKAVIEDIHRFVAERLPVYMIPSAIVLLEELPLTMNGKIDRNRLPLAMSGPHMQRSKVLPRTQVEEALVDIWKRILRVEDVGIDDNFFELGGNSMLGMRLSVLMLEEIGIGVPAFGILRDPTIRSLSKFVDEITSRGSVPNSSNVDRKHSELMVAGGREPRTAPLQRCVDIVPLSFQQEQFVQFSRTHPSWCWVTAQLRLCGELRIDCLRRSFHNLLNRHESLRTHIVMLDGMLKQRVDPPRQYYHLPLLDFSDRDRDAAGIEIADCVLRLFTQEVDITTGPLFEARLLKISGSEHVLLVAIHHILCDGVSIAVFFKELWMTYMSLLSGGERLIRGGAVQYSEYCSWQRRVLADPDGRIERHWYEKLAGASSIHMPKDQASKCMAAVNGPLTIEANFGLALSSRLRELSREYRTMPALVVVAIYASLVTLWCSQRRFVLPIFFSGRVRSEHVSVIGLLASGIPLLINVRGDESFHEILSSIRDEFVSGCEHFDFGKHSFRAPEVLRGTSLNWVGDSEAIEGTPQGTDWESICPNLQIHSRGSVSRRGYPLEREIMWGFRESSGCISGRAMYRCDMFSSATMERLRIDFIHLSEYVCRDPLVSIKSFQLSPAE